VDAFIELYDEDSLSDFEEAYVGEYNSEAEFAEQYYDMCGDGKIPSWIVVDWDATWNSSLRFDFDEQDGYFFRSC
jgi:antirestriction protein